ncbi:MAG: helix-turn-helix transcriptional regulator [Bdellovibrionales bacterium]|nr:helix-turn-helix transcriptional regulator [Bdellovibrionales bacterium]
MVPPIQKTANPKTLSRHMRSARFFGLLAETFKAMGDESRVKIIWSLAHGTLSVGQLSELLGMSQPAVSHHLRTLRNLKLVQVRKSGTTAYYSLDDEHIDRLLQEGTEHVEDLMK